MGDAANPVNWSVFRPPIWALRELLEADLWRSDKLTHFCSDLRPMNPARNRLRIMGDRLTTIAVLDEVVGHFW